MTKKYINKLDQHMIPRVGRRGISPTTRTIRAQVVRTETRSAGNGERNIHHADCIDVRVGVRSGEHPGSRQQPVHRHTSLNTLIPARCKRGNGAGGTTAPIRPARTGWLSHTLNTPSFFVLEGKRATSFSYQVKDPSKWATIWRSPRGEKAPSILSR
jgi:hypothetical protein